MRLGHTVWRSLAAPLSAPPALGGRGLPELPLAPDLYSVAAELGHLPRIERKPWVLISDVREDLEKEFDLATDELLVVLAQWLAQKALAPASVGLAHISGNVYLAPALDLGASELLSPEQVLVGSLFSHGEIGLDAFASVASPPTASGGDLFLEVATLKRLRWLDASAALPREVVRNQGSAQRHQRQIGEVIKMARPRLFKKYPLLSDLLGVEGASGDGEKGNCLQHPNFEHHDLVGDSMEEMQASAARVAAARSYRPPALQASGGPCLGPPAAGCALLTEAGLLFAGSEVVTRTGHGGLSPLQCALISLGANGQSPSSVLSVMWCGVDVSLRDTQQLRQRDEEILRAVAPHANFSAVDWAVE
ncbi:unnamed protein product [Polarella glacialis]|uniref:Uncharacterized protein n=1 Tax=Polarella glacialis TaxID=89957 RepID=A0A813EP99_POLGL|nr:unnamed protein product [Polarella glacialis]